MSTRTTLNRLALAGAVAAMLASASHGAFAQVADTPAAPPTAPTSTPPGPTSTTPDNANTTTPSATPGPATSTDTTAPGSGSMSSGSMSSGSMDSGSTASMPMSGMSKPSVPTPPTNLPTDYSILNNRVFDNTDLSQARARGLTDSQIATIVKISKETGFSFQYVSAQVERGVTFPALATMYGLKLADVYSNDKEKQEVSDYDALSSYAKSLGKSDSGAMSMPMSGGSMTPPMTSPSAPSTTMPMTPTESTTPSSEPDIVQTAMAAKNLTTLVKALQVAGLVETLKGAGPFTVFAPDDKAFAKLPAGALDALLADPAKLKQVLTYHVIPGNITAADASSMSSPTSPPTVEGATLQVTKGKKGKLKINDATVTKADIKASNGTIHIINEVLMPPATDSATPPATTDTTTPPPAPAAPGTTDTTPPAAPAPMDQPQPAAPGTPGTTDVTPPTAPATPGTTDTTPPTATPTTPATPGQ